MDASSTNGTGKRDISSIHPLLPQADQPGGLSIGGDSRRASNNMPQFLQKIFGLVALASCISTGHAKAQAMLWGGLVAGAAKETYAGELINCKTYKEENYKMWCDTVTQYNIGEYSAPANLLFFKSRLASLNLELKDKNCEIKNRDEKECLRKYTLTLVKIVRALTREYGRPTNFGYGSRYNRNDRSLLASWNNGEVRVYVMADDDNSKILIFQSYNLIKLK